jgi:hypothetical protein
MITAILTIMPIQTTITTTARGVEFMTSDYFAGKKMFASNMFQVSMASDMAVTIIDSDCIVV